MTATALLRVASLLVCATLLFGCLVTTDDSSRTKAEGTALGAVIGALAGAAIADEDEKEKGALIGAIIGGGGGYLIGAEIAKRKRQYKTTEDFYDGQIQVANEYSKQLHIASTNLKRENQTRQAQSARLNRQYQAGRLNRDRARALHAKMARGRQKVERLIADADKEIKVQEKVVADLRQTKGAKNHRTRQLQKKVDAMRQYNRELQNEVQILTDYDANIKRVI